MSRSVVDFDFDVEEEEEEDEMKDASSIHAKIDAAAREIGVYGVYSHDALMKGYNAELEHGRAGKSTNVTDGDVLATVKIAVAHLEEFPDYYERLDVLERDDFWTVVNLGQESSRSHVIVTVPHSTCPSIDLGHHPCDLVAGKAAMELTVALTNSGHQTMIFMGGVHRVKALGGIDLNRAESRNTAFRRELTEEMMKATKSAIRHSSSAVLIDVHSFSEESSPDFGSYPMVVMDPQQRSRTSHTGYVMEFVRIAKDKGLSIGYIRGGPQNDIVMEARDIGMKAFILEIHESTFRPQQLSKLWEAVGEWSLLN